MALGASAFLAQLGEATTQVGDNGDVVAGGHPLKRETLVRIQLALAHAKPTISIADATTLRMITTKAIITVHPAILAVVNIFALGWTVMAPMHP